MYPHDLIDAEWRRVVPPFQPKDRRGSGCKHEKKRLVEAILDIVKGGSRGGGYLKIFLPGKRYMTISV
jgi:transposase